MCNFYIRGCSEFNYWYLPHKWNIGTPLCERTAEDKYLSSMLTPVLILLFGCCFRTDKLHITWIFPTFTTLLLLPAVTAIPNVDAEHSLFQMVAHCFSLSPCRHSLSWIRAQQVARYSKFAHSIFVQCLIFGQFSMLCDRTVSLLSG